MVLALLCALALVASGCAGDDSGAGSEGSDTTAGSSDAATGEPIPVGQIIPIEAGGLSLADQALATRVAVEALNASGGLAGRPLDLLQCDSQGDPNTELECARQMVDEGVVATLADATSFNADAVSETLADAGIPRIGLIQSSVSEYQAENVFGFTSGGVLLLVGMLNVLVEAGNTRISLLRFDIPAAAALSQLLAPVAEELGAELVNDVSVTTGATDYTQFVQGASDNGATGAVLVLGNTEALQVATAAGQIGSDLTLSMTTSSVTQSNLEELGVVAEQAVFSDSLPAPTAVEEFPGLTTILDQFEASGEETLEPQNLTTSAVRAWLSVHAFAEVMSGAPTIDASSVMAAFAAAEDVDMLGLIPPWTPGVFLPAGTFSDVFANVSNPMMFSETFDGEQVIVDPDQFDVLALMPQS